MLSPTHIDQEAFLFQCVWPEDVPKDVLFRPYPTAEERAPPPVRDASPSSSSASISYMPMLPLTMSFPDSSLFGMHLGEDESSFGGSQLWVAGLEPDITYPPTPLSQTDDLCFGPAPFVDKAEWLPPEEQLKASPKLYIVPSSPLELTFPNPEERALVGCCLPSLGVHDSPDLINFSDHLPIREPRPSTSWSSCRTLLWSVRLRPLLLPGIRADVNDDPGHPDHLILARSNDEPARSGSHPSVSRRAPLSLYPERLLDVQRCAFTFCESLNAHPADKRLI